MYRQLILSSTLLCTAAACTLPQEPAPELVPYVRDDTRQLLEHMRQEVQTLREDMSRLNDKVQEIDPWTVRVARLEDITATLALLQPKGKGMKTKPSKPQPELKPIQIVEIAQRAARIEPTARGYWGQSAEQVFQWAPGKLYTIYVTPKHVTLLVLEPGEKLVAGCYLPKEDFTVDPKHAGDDLTGYDTIAITPTSRQVADTDTFILTKSGRRILLHLVNGDEGMVSVTFETATVRQSGSPEQKLPLPRPQP